MEQLLVTEHEWVDTGQPEIKRASPSPVTAHGSSDTTLPPQLSRACGPSQESREMTPQVLRPLV
jgi:hypothetical protein